MPITSCTAGLAGCLLLFVSAGQALERRIAEADLDTRILLLEESTQRFRQVSDRRTFYDGQRFKLSVRPSQSGYLYVLCMTSQGEVKLLHPTTVVDNHVDGGRTLSFPERGWFRFDHDPGTERLYVVLSEQPVRELDQVLEDGIDLTPATLRQFAARPPQGILVEPGTRDIDVVPQAAPWAVKRIQLRHEQWSLR